MPERRHALKGLRCPDCLTENLIGTFYCSACAAPLLPVEMIPAAERPGLLAPQKLGPTDEPIEETTAGRARSHDALHESTETVRQQQDDEPSPSAERRYRIIRGDSCPVCRAASHITFTVDRTPQIPVAGCRDPAGCRCMLPEMETRSVRPPHPVTERHTDAVEAMPQRAPLLYDETTDSLSGEALLVFTTALVSEAMRRGFPLAVILLRAGDTNGEAGAVLEAPAQLLVLLETIRRTVRAGDLIGRFDARTFAVVAQGAEEAGATQIVERVRAALSLTAPSDGGSVPNLRHGVAVLPTAGTTVQELFQHAAGPLIHAEGSRRGLNKRSSGGIPGPLADGASGRNELALLLAEYERGELEAITIETEAGACPVCVDASRDAYRPEALPPLPLVGCGGLDGCRCHYGRARSSGGRSAPPLPAVTPSPLDIPRAWQAAALFGQDPKQSCRPQDLAAYLDAFPLLPVRIELPLQPGEAAYLLRQGRRGVDQAAAALMTGHLSEFPLHGSLAGWLAKLSKPPRAPFEAIPFWDPGLLCITNLRIIFGRRGAVESIMLREITSVGYLRGGFCCTAGKRGLRTVFLMPDALQVGLCLTRAMRDILAAAE